MAAARIRVNRGVPNIASNAMTADPRIPNYTFLANIAEKKRNAITPNPIGIIDWQSQTGTSAKAIVPSSYS
jgi:hypothetical protein